MAFVAGVVEKDNITQRELSNEAGTTEASTMQTLRGLVEAGLATRTRCTKDKRKIYIALTPRARRLRARLLPMVVDVNEIAAAGIDPAELEITRRVLARTYENLCTALGEGHD